MSVSRDPYEVLGVPRNASTAQIRAAYLARARLAHPDLVGRSGLHDMRSLNEAWEILKDRGRRQAWDAAHHVPHPSAAPGAPPSPGQDRPFWTGAMGPPPGRPSGPVLEFGIYDGWSLGEIARRDPGYLVWLRDRPEGRFLQAEIATLLGLAGEEPRAARREARRW